jgi:hypothetical protein
MRFHRVLVVLMSIAVSAPASPVLGGQHVLDAEQLAAALITETGSAHTQRMAIHDALAQPRVRRIAATLAMDGPAIDTAVEALSGADLEKAADLARQINAQGVPGPSSITVSTTTLVVVLLVLILVVVSLK